MKYFDSHCHPQLSAFDADREEVLERMREGGIGGLVVGTDLEESRKAVDLASKYDFLWATIGLHPNDTEEQFDISNYEKLSQNKKVVAIGECGLDFYRNKLTEEERHRQIERFAKHQELAEKVGKPLMIHCRPTQGTQNAHEEILAMLPANSHELENKEKIRAVIHFFTSTTEIAKRYLELGCYLSFPGVITFTDMYDDAVRVTPIERILSETDSPFAAPVPHRGKRNEPFYVKEVVKRIAEIKEMSVEEVQRQTLLNFQRIFKLDKMAQKEYNKN